MTQKYGWLSTSQIGEIEKNDRQRRHLQKSTIEIKEEHKKHENMTRTIFNNERIDLKFAN